MLSFLFNSNIENSNNNKQINTDENAIIDNANVNIPHDSLMLNISISLLGLLLTIIYYNNFVYSVNYNFLTLFIAGVMILLTAFDIIYGCRKYKINGWKAAVNVTAGIGAFFAFLLLVVIVGISAEIFDVNKDLEIFFTQQKQLSSLNDFFKRNNLLLNINEYIKLYPLTYAVQSLANFFKFILKRHKTHKKSKKNKKKAKKII